jgi:hypothetical protein
MATFADVAPDAIHPSGLRLLSPRGALLVGLHWPVAVRAWRPVSLRVI